MRCELKVQAVLAALPIDDLIILAGFRRQAIPPALPFS